MRPIRRYSLVEWGALGAAAFTVALGGLTIVGWLGGYVDLLRFANPGPTLRFNTALMFVLCGASLACHVTQRRRAATILAASTILFCAIYLLDRWSGGRLGVETLFVSPSDELVRQVGNGRMAMGAAWCFMLCGAALIARRSAYYGVAVASLMGTTICMISLVALNRFAMGTDQWIGWPVTVGMALTTAAGLLALGTATVALAYREAAAAGSTWLAYPLAIALAAASIMVWHELDDNERTQLQRATASAASGIEGQIRERLALRLDAVQRLAGRWNRLSKQLRRHDARRILKDFHGMLTISWIDQDRKIMWICAAEGRDVLGTPLPAGPRHNAIDRAHQSRAFAFTPVLQLLHGDSGFIGYMPTVDSADHINGYLAVVFRTDLMFEAVARDFSHFDFDFAIEQRDREVFVSDPQFRDAAPVVETRGFALSGLNWRIEAWPTRTTAAAYLTSVPELALVKGLLSALLLGIAIQLRQQSIRQTAEIKRSAEAWRSSEQRFDLAVRGSRDGIWEWRAGNEGFYGSPLYREMLGYPPGDAPLSFEEWFTRVHPEDLAGIRFAIDNHFERRTPYDVTVRYFTFRETWIWLRIRGQAAWDKQGEPLCMAGSVSDVTEQREAERMLLAHVETIAASNRALVELAEAAEAAAQAKATFLRNMSHELRTPLNSIIGFSTGLLRRTASHAVDEHQRDRIERIAASGRHLLQLVNNVLDISKAEAGEKTSHVDQFELGELVSELSAMIEPLLQRKTNVRFQAEIATGLPAPLLDRIKLKQVLLNLLGNAVKFTDRGSISLHVSFADDCWQFAVSDTGVGVSHADHQRIFENFEQVCTPGRQTEGTGLGLSICVSLAAAMHGQITLESRLGVGSTFLLIVPQSKIAHDTGATPARPDAQVPRVA